MWNLSLERKLAFYVRSGTQFSDEEENSQWLSNVKVHSDYLERLLEEFWAPTPVTYLELGKGQESAFWHSGDVIHMVLRATLLGTLL